MLAEGSRSFFMFSIENAEEKNTAQFMQKQFKPLLDSLVQEGIELIAIAVDNESTMKALVTGLQQQYPVLIHVPCSAHTLQLCLKKIGELAEFAPILSHTSDIIDEFCSDKSMRLQLRNLQKQGTCGTERAENPFRLIKPGATRWSSRITASERLLALSKAIQVLEDASAFQIILPQEASFWASLGSLTAFLIPFRVATDTVQRDNASLLDVWKEFNLLEQHLSQQQQHVSFGPTSTECLIVLRKEWTNHVNRSAVAAVALLSFDSSASSLLIPQPENLAKWIANWGSTYLTTYKKVEGNKHALKTQLQQLVLDFRARQSPFDSLDGTIQFVKQTAVKAGKQFNPLVVWGNIENDSTKPLAIVAKALLRIVPTEATVERSFSAQDDVHRRDRNRLSQPLVQAEMMIKWNSRKLKNLSLPEEEDLELSDADE